MKFIIDLKNTCNIFIPRNIYSLFLVLSKKNFHKGDNFILLNRHKSYSYQIPKYIIIFLKKKKFKIIYINKSYKFNKNKDLTNSFINKLFKINYFKYLKKVSEEMLEIKYEEFNNINFDNYKTVNIYYGSNILYYSNLYKRFKNINFFFLEHGVGNFLAMIQEHYACKKNYKKFIINIIKFIIFKIKGVCIPNSSFYYGICGHTFDVKKLEYDNQKITILKSNFKKGFQQLFNFFQKDLKKIKKIKKNNYIFLNIPYHYELKMYKKYLDYICEKVKFKKNIIILIKIHFGINEKKYLDLLLNTLRLKKIKYYLFSKKVTKIPAEIIIKYFNVSEIYSGYSTILFSSYYLFHSKKKFNVIFSDSIKKKFINLPEFNQFSKELIKKHIKKNTNYVDLDHINQELY